LRRFIAAFILFSFSGSAASAHSSSRGFVLLLPTSVIILTGALTVAVSFVAFAALPRGLFIRGGENKRTSLISIVWPEWIGLALSGASFVGVLLLVTIGYLGSTDPLSNPLPLIIWTAWWMFLVVLTPLLGNVWAILNPFIAPHAIVFRATGWSGFRVSPVVGNLLALAIVVVFGWWQLVHVTPEDPRQLATLVTVYFLFTLAAGPAWYRRFDPFYTFFQWLGSMSPLDWRKGLALRWPGGELVSASALTLLQRLLLVGFLGILSFDGLMGSFFWNNLIGVNPLAFEGRSTVRDVNTFGLLACLVGLALLVEGSIWLGQRQAGSRVHISTQIVLSLVCIAVALHFAHFLPDMLVNGQYLYHAMLDPMGYGHADVSTSFLNTSKGSLAIYAAQSAAVIAGHVLAVIVTHVAVRRLEVPQRARFWLELPPALLMVLYSWFSLWSLSTPTI
jgi:hypothetical protein